MGRGRAKAKQTRVARDLKYRFVETDFASLERELQGKPTDDDDTFEDQSVDDYADVYEDAYDEDGQDTRA